MQQGLCHLREVVINEHRRIIKTCEANKTSVKQRRTTYRQPRINYNNLNYILFDNEIVSKIKTKTHENWNLFPTIKSVSRHTVLLYEWKFKLTGVSPYAVFTWILIRNKLEFNKTTDCIYYFMPMHFCSMQHAQKRKKFQMFVSANICQSPVLHVLTAFNKKNLNFN